MHEIKGKISSPYLVLAEVLCPDGLYYFDILRQPIRMRICYCRERPSRDPKEVLGQPLPTAIMDYPSGDYSAPVSGHPTVLLGEHAGVCLD
jgi:hypothetical protein